MDNTDSPVLRDRNWPAVEWWQMSVIQNREVYNERCISKVLHTPQRNIPTKTVYPR